LQRRLDEGELAPDFGRLASIQRGGGYRRPAPLIAFNVNLRGELGRTAIGRPRRSRAGLPGVRALGSTCPARAREVR